jgi:uncharacterized phage protein (TIGR02216 family)
MTDEAPAKKPATFSANAQQLFGQTMLLLGWRPSEFWAATPQELSCILAAMAPRDEAPIDSQSIRQLMAQFPDKSGG